MKEERFRSFFLGSGSDKKSGVLASGTKFRRDSKKLSN